MAKIEFGTALPSMDNIAQFAQRVENLGFDYLGCGEHVMFHGPVGNTFISLSVAAGAVGCNGHPGEANGPGCEATARKGQLATAGRADRGIAQDPVPLFHLVHRFYLYSSGQKPLYQFARICPRRV